MKFSGYILLNKEDEDSYRSIQNTAKSIVEKNSKYELIAKKHLYILLQKPTISSSKLEYLVNDNEVFIGSVFKKGDPSGISINKVLAKYKHKAFEDFIRDYWGSYIWIREHEGKLHIFKSPGCKHPLFYTLKNNAIYFGSEIEILDALIEEKTEFRWDMLAQFLVKGPLNAVSESYFEDIFQITSGCSLEINKKGIHEKVIWNPELICAKEANPLNSDINSYTYPLVNSIEETLICETLPNDVVYLLFSGGVDSSTILYSLNKVLKNTHTKLKAIHMYNPMNAASDERVIANKICQTLGTELIEMNKLEYLPFSPLNDVCKPNQPNPKQLYQKAFNTFRNLDFGKKSIIVSGSGGDNLFMSSPNFESLADYFIYNKFNGLYEKFKDYSIQLNASIYKIVYNLIKILLKTCIKHNHNGFTNDAMIPEWGTSLLIKRSQKISNKSHPFFKKRRKLLPGKSNLVREIYDCWQKNPLNIIDFDNPIIYPFFSQIVLEQLLKAPTHLFFDAMKTRYLVKKAIAQRHPKALIWRESKAEFSHQVILGLKENKKAVFEYCLEGKFAQNKLVNKKKLENAIHQAIRGDTQKLWPISHLYCIETFISSWQL